MTTNKIFLPSFIDLFSTGTVNVNLQFESAATINYTLFLSSTEKYNVDKYEIGTTTFSAYGYTFKLGNSKLSIDPVNRKKMLSVNFVGYKPSEMSETTYAELLSKNINPFEITPYSVNVSSTNLGDVSMGISDSYILSLEVNYTSNDRKYWTFTPTRLKWGKQEYESNDDGNSQTNKPIYEKIPQPESVSVIDSENAQTAPNQGVVNDFSLNFDASGQTKIKETNYYAGTRLIKKKVEEYGYSFHSDDPDVAEYFAEDPDSKPQPIFKNTALNQFWNLVNYYTINYLYDENGYYLGYDKKGNKKVRFATETEFEILDLTTQTDPPDFESANAYRFFWTPIIEYERLELHAYSNYYEDAKPSINDLYVMYQEWNSSINDYEWKYTKNLEYVQPMFVKKQLNYLRCFEYKYVDSAHQLNPEQQINKLITTGEESKTSKTINILNNQDIYEYEEDSKKEDSYEVLTENVSSQDDNFRNFIKQVNSESNFGRPPQADYYQIYKIQEEEQNLNEDQPNIDPIIWIAHKNTDVVNIEDEDTQITETIYENATNVESAFDQLKFELRKSLLFSGDEFIISSLYLANVKPNYKITCSYNGKSYVGIVKSVDHSIEILNKGVGKAYTNIVVAMENSKNNMWQDLVLSDEENPDLPDSVTTPPLDTSEFITIGNVSDIYTLIEGLPTRGEV